MRVMYLNLNLNNRKVFVFADGSIPPDDVVKQFVDLCDSRFGPESKNPKATISVFFISLSDM